jgi:hypothetical protein
MADTEFTFTGTVQQGFRDEGTGFELVVEKVSPETPETEPLVYNVVDIEPANELAKSALERYSTGVTEFLLIRATLDKRTWPKRGEQPVVRATSIAPEREWFAPERGW